MIINRPIKKLGEIARVFAGSSAPQLDVFFENGKYPFIRTGDLGKYKITFNLTEVGDYINDECLKTNNLVKVKKGTIIFPKSGASVLTNNRGMLGIDGYLVSHLAAIDSENEITNKYIFYFLLDFDFAEVCENIAYPSLKLSDIKEIVIPLPPLATQKAIVAKLDETFAQIDEAITTTQANIQSTDEFVKSVLDKIFEEGKGEKTKLGKVITLNYGKGLDKNDRSENGLYNVYGANGVLAKSDKYLIEGESIIIGRKGSAGALTRINGKFRPTDVTYYVTLNQKGNMDYIYLALQRLNLESLAKGVKPGINRNEVYALEIPLPPLAKQAEIVTYLDKVFAQSSKLKSQYQAKLTELKELKASILQGAFEGKLI